MPPVINLSCIKFEVIMPPKKRGTNICFFFNLLKLNTNKKLGSDVQTARGRLKGALQDAVGGTEDEDEINETPASAMPNRGRPPKRYRKEMPPNQMQQEQPHQSFIMKLFDRSVDLAKYNENTALYPICRAWMLNQPRSNKLTKYAFNYRLEKIFFLKIKIIFFFFQF